MPIFWRYAVDRTSELCQKLTTNEQEWLITLSSATYNIIWSYSSLVEGGGSTHRAVTPKYGTWNQE
jgi:hypothetical protein